MNKPLAHWPLLSAIVLLCLGALPTHAQDTAGSEMMMMNPAGMKWVDGPPSMPKGLKLAVLYGEPMTLVVKRDSQLRDGRDIQERLKKDPKSLSLAIGIALGGTNHLSVALVMRAMGIDVKNLKTVVFQANADTQTALMGGHVDLAPLSLATAQEAMRQGKVRILGISMAQRGDGPLADIPTWKEQGFDVQFTNTRFLLAPKGLTPPQLAWWDGVVASAPRDVGTLVEQRHAYPHPQRPGEQREGKNGRYGRIHTTSAPVVTHGLVIVGSSIDDNQRVRETPGAVHAFDAAGAGGPGRGRRRHGLHGRRAALYRVAALRAGRPSPGDRRAVGNDPIVRARPGIVSDLAGHLLREGNQRGQVCFQEVGSGLVGDLAGRRSRQ